MTKYFPKVFVERNLFIYMHQALVTKHPSPVRKIWIATFIVYESGRLDVPEVFVECAVKSHHLPTLPLLSLSLLQNPTHLIKVHLAS